ncbi:MAG: NAD-dependent deacetylase [Lachnospiraceae bacterium]|nr:NAD-dependent deacetylase [Lachnospiraceae bacterium]
MDSKLDKMKELIQKSDHIVLVSGLGVIREAGLNGVRAEHIAYDIEQKYGYDNDEIVSSMFLSKRVELFYQYYKEVILNKEMKPTPVHEGAARLEKAGKLDAVIKRTTYSMYDQVGCKNVIDLHGSVDENYCPNCGKVYGSEFIRKAEGLPLCEECSVPLRPGFTLLGEMVDNGKMSKASDAVENADVLLVVGSSLTSPLCQHLIKYYKGNKMLLINDQETVGDERADYRAYGNLSELFSYVTDIKMPEKKETAAKKDKKKDKKKEAKNEQD